MKFVGGELDFEHVHGAYHAIPLQNLYAIMETDPEKGLTRQKAAERLKENGLNKLTDSVRRREFFVFLKTCGKDVSLLLWYCVFLGFVTYIEELSVFHENDDEIIVGAALLIVTVVQRIINYYNIEPKPDFTCNEFQFMIPPYATVIRDGIKLLIPANRLVVGDIVDLKMGHRIPADIRIIESNNFYVDNCKLNGKTQPQLRTSKFLVWNALKAKNVALCGAFAVGGSARGVVISCGDNTMLGRVAKISTRPKPLTSFEAEINRTLFISLAMIGIVSLCSLLLYNFAAFEWYGALWVHIGIILSLTPECLHGIIVLGLCIRGYMMLSKNCYIRALERLLCVGQISVLVTDLIGTLTRNDPHITKVWIDNRLFNVDSEASTMRQSGAFKAICRCATLCNSSYFRSAQDGVPYRKRQIIGDPIDATLLRFTEHYFTYTEEIREDFPKVAEIPFHKINKFQLSIHKIVSETEKNIHLLVMKGDPNTLLKRCSKIYINGQDVPLTQEHREEIIQHYTVLIQSGIIMMGFCDYTLPPVDDDYTFTTMPINFQMDRLRFLGLLGSYDRPRENVLKAVLRCRDAGIKVIVCTKSDVYSAKATAKSVGIIAPGSNTVEDIAAERNVPVSEVDPSEAEAAVINCGKLLERIPNARRQIEFILQEHAEVVFARTSDQQKLQIIDVCQQLGGVVACTGICLMDAPCVRKADIGFSMGLAGARATKLASDVTILNDNFVTIVQAIEQSRIIYENLKKAVVYTLTSNMPQFAAFIGFAYWDLPTPFDLTGIIVVELVTDLLPAISLFFEEAEDKIMERPPVMKTEWLINRRVYIEAYLQLGIIEIAAAYFAYFAVMADNGFFPPDLVNLRRPWNLQHVNDLIDSYGQEWTYKERKILERKCHAAYMMAIIIMQWCNLLVCKTRRASLFQHGMTNHPLTFIFLVYFGVGVYLCFDGQIDILHLSQININYILYTMPFIIIMIIYEEFRKYYMRQNPGGFVERETFY